MLLFFAHPNRETTRVCWRPLLLGWRPSLFSSFSHGGFPPAQLRGPPPRKSATSWLKRNRRTNPRSSDARLAMGLFQDWDDVGVGMNLRFRCPTHGRSGEAGTRICSDNGAPWNVKDSRRFQCSKSYLDLKQVT